MVGSREEACETCGEYNLVRNMRQLTIRRVVGEETGRSASERHSNRHSTMVGGSSKPRFSNSNANSFGVRTNRRRITRNERVWVCKTCPDPPSEGQALGNVILIALIVIAALWGLSKIGVDVGALIGRLTGAGDKVLSSRPAAPADTPVEGADAPSGTVAASTSPDPKPPVATVEPLPAPRTADYPPCSATVTDHCTGG